MSDIENLKRIIGIDSELNKIQDVDLLLERILLEARRVMNAEAGTIYVREDDRLVFKYSQNDEKQKHLPAGQKLIYSFFSVEINEKTISGYCASTGEILNIPDVYEIRKDAPYAFNKSYDKISEYTTKSCLAIPLKATTGHILGVLQLINAKDEAGEIVAFAKEDVVFASHFAASASTALQRASLTRAMILRMIRMSELRDPKETGAHVNRVSGYALEIYERWAAKNEVPVKDMERYRDVLKMAAMLHDVGKVAISDLILKKPGSFTDDEYMVMQAHTYYGARLFEDIQSDLDVTCAEVALTHHENWDGTGYPGYIDLDTGEPVSFDEVGRPLKRKAQDIPLAGRIVAIADVYDALMSRRVYKEPWDEGRVLDEMKKMSGAKFDPDLVDIFFEVLPNIKQIRNRYPDQE